MQPLPGDLVRLSRSLQGIELYFPPLRTPGAALALALFGIACLIPGFFATLAVTPLAQTGPSGVLAIWLMSIFILPFLAFGVLFLALAVYQIANSLAVSVTESEIRTLRRVFGLALRERRVAIADVAALEAVTVIRHRRPREGVSYYSLVIRTKSGAGLTMREAHRGGRLEQFLTRKVVVAESLRGEAIMEQVRAEIVKAGRLERLVEGVTRDS
jgi:hypothetical protein